MILYELKEFIIWYNGEPFKFDEAARRFEGGA